MQLFFRRNLCDRSEIDGDVPRKVCMQHQSLTIGLHDLAAQMVTVFQGDLIGVYRRHECQAQNGENRYAFTQHCYLQLSESLTTQCDMVALNYGARQETATERHLNLKEVTRPQDTF